uniref:MurR/RpiR family transcriptional regulator n=1 Tax=Neorhizobium sp. EC2-8 TaxID=3129230 RepID=UPI003100C271
MGDNAPPASLKAFEEKLLEVSEGLPKRLRQCADYVAANKDRIAVSTVAEMAEGAGVQPSALMRFCQILGFSGFSEMQRLFRESYVGGWPDYSTRLQHLREKPEGSPAALLGEFVDAGRASLESLLNTVDPATLTEAANLLSAANVVHIIGLGRSFSIATYMAYIFEKMEVPAVLHTSLGKLDNRHAIRDGDALLAFTFSPYSAPTLDLVENTAARNIPVVAVTDSAIGPLAKFRPVTLLVSEVDFGAFRSPAATLCLATALAVSVGTAKPASG